MLRNTTFNLPDELVRHAKAYAAREGTSMTALVREHLEQITGWVDSSQEMDPVQAFSEGKMTKKRAIQLLGLRDYLELLHELGKRGLPLPKMEERHIQIMSETLRSAMGDEDEEV